MKIVNGYTDGLRAFPGPPGDGGVAEGSAPPCTDSDASEEATATRAKAAAVPSGFDAVYCQHFDFVCRSLRLLGVSPDGLEDSAQDVFGVVSRRLAEFVPDARLETWLFAIVQRVAANHRRTRRRKQAPLEPLSEPLATNDPSPEAHAEASQAAALIETFAAGLDDGHRAVLVLALIERLPVRDVAEALGIPLFTVYSRIRSVRGKLEAYLEAHEVEI